MNLPFVVLVVGIIGIGVQGYAERRLWTWAGVGLAPGYVNGVGTAARLGTPTSTVAGVNSDVYFTDDTNCIVGHIDSNRTVTTIAGNGTCGYLDGSGKNAMLWGPVGLARLPNGSLFVMEQKNCVVRRIDPATGNAAIILGNGTSDYRDGVGRNTRFIRPVSAAVTPDGLVAWIGDQYCIRRLDMTTMNLTTFVGDCVNSGYVFGNRTATRIDLAFCLILAADGVLYVGGYDSHVIYKILPDGTSSYIAGSPFTSGCIDGTGEANFFEPGHPDFAPNGLLLVADFWCNQVRSVNLTSGMVSTYIGLPRVQGVVDGPEAVAQLWFPFSVTMLTNGAFVVAEYQGNCIRLGAELQIPDEWTNLTIVENSPIGSFVAQLSTPSFVSYTLLNGTDTFVLTPAGLLTTTTGIDFESTSQFLLAVRCLTMMADLTVDKVLVVNVGDVNETITLAPTVVSPNAPIGTVVGTFNTFGVRDGSGFRYSFSSHAVNQNSLFNIVVDKLATNAVLRYRKGSSFNVEIHAVNGSGLSITTHVFRIDAVNHAPIVAFRGNSSNVTALIGHAGYAYFDVSDPDGDVLSCSIATVDAAGVRHPPPEWVQFSQVSGFISLTLKPQKAQRFVSLPITVICTDYVNETMSTVIVNVESSLTAGTVLASTNGTLVSIPTIITSAAFMSVDLQLHDPGWGRLALDPFSNVISFQPNFVTGNYRIFGTPAGVNDALSNRMRYVPITPTTRRIVRQDVATFVCDDGINPPLSATLPMNLFPQNQPPQVVTPFVSISLITGSTDIVPISTFFSDSNNDTLTISVGLPGKPVVVEWISVQMEGAVTVLTTQPRASHVGDWDVTITASDSYGGYNTTRIKATIILSSEEQFLVALRWILQALAMITFLFTLYHYRVAAYNHFRYRKYHWETPPEELMNGAPYTPQELGTNQTLAAEPGTRCRVFMLVDNPVTGWILGRRFRHLGCSCFVTPRVSGLDSRIALEYFYAPWLRWNSKDGTLQLVPDSIPRYEENYLIQVVDRSEKILQEFLLNMRDVAEHLGPSVQKPATAAAADMSEALGLPGFAARAPLSSIAPPPVTVSEMA